MNVTTNWNLNDPLRRPVTIEGALEERRRPFGVPFCVKRPVSEGRMVPPTPFETKRKRPQSGPLDGFSICMWRRGWA